MAERPLGAVRAVPWTGIFVALGLGLRTYHLLRGPSLWQDEAAVIVNVLRKSFLGLLGPLQFANPSPPLFLWIEKIVGILLGESALAWRLVPFLASCLALVLFVPVARRILRPDAVPWAVLLFACSDRLLWHSCEAKPYTVDVLCAVGLLAVYCGSAAWPVRRQLAVYAALAPVLIFLSYPGSFLCGALMVAKLPQIWRERQVRTWLACAVFGLTIVLSFGILLIGPIRAQRCDQLMGYWTRQFPNWGRPWSVPVWTVTSTFEMLRYCAKPTGGLLIMVVGVGMVQLWKDGRRCLVAFLVVPVVLALLAAYLKYYPYGHSRTEVYAAPAVILLLAAGLPATFAWLRARARFAELALAGLLLAPVGLTAYRLVVHWERADSAGGTAYVLAHRSPNDVVEGNQWEHEYYFRHLGPCFIPSVGNPAMPTDRLWVITAGATSDDRLAPVKQLSAEWHIREQCEEFERTTIVLLERSGVGKQEPGDRSQGRGERE
jgi:hypothetical protein